MRYSCCPGCVQAELEAPPGPALFHRILSDHFKAVQKPYQRTVWFPWLHSWLPLFQTGTGGQPAQCSPQPVGQKKNLLQQLFSSLVDIFYKANKTHKLPSPLTPKFQQDLHFPQHAEMQLHFLTWPHLCFLLSIRKCKSSRVQVRVVGFLNQYHPTRTFTERVSPSWYKWTLRPWFAVVWAPICRHWFSICGQTYYSLGLLGRFKSVLL